MSIRYVSNDRIFHLQTSDTSYLFRIHPKGYIQHLYWGRSIPDEDALHMSWLVQRASFSPNPDPNDLALSLDTLPQEYPGYGTSDLRGPAYEMMMENGSSASELKYVEHTIAKGKPKLKGLPATYTESDEEADTLEVVLEDAVSGLQVRLSYTVFHELNAIARSVRFENRSGASLRLNRALSMSVDFDRSSFRMLHLHGAWARERHIAVRELAPGTQSIESRRGSSSHQHNPFIALLGKDASEDYGDVYGFSLVYSGSFLASVEVDQFHTTRVALGINPFDFSWLLEPGESFQTPEAVLVYSSSGLGQMSRTYHDLYRSRLCRGVFRDRERPILANNWEATYFNFNADKITAIAEAGKQLGIELFVLDDGWFGKRDSDNCSLGDWFVDRNKLPNGLKSLAESIEGMDMKFGLWFEPEMVSPDSELYRKHPDWCLHVPGRRRSEARNQLILDYSREDVREYIVNVISDVLGNAPISYVKWDMNRNMSEIGSAQLPPERQRETAHRYMLGLYEVLEGITSRFPNILFESCSGGGGRFDPGMLYYMPQTWTSDNSDAVSRLKIQFGTSIVYPTSTMGAHVSAVPNHQVGRSEPLSMRAHVAYTGAFGYELDLSKMSEEDKAATKEHIAFYKTIRKLVQFGDFYRILSPFEGDETAWAVVSKDKNEAFAAYFQTRNEANAPLERLKLKGLDPDKKYRIEGTDTSVSGGFLMNVGLKKPGAWGDYFSAVFYLKAE
ncbi:alpha-galactosidase [Paenibacillus thermotolerans]|uniref:alpha-galactosidase n=1 Tax=Paenibacillus thermotolerans TaxID=3027807 RepID=UPI002367977F|nr:MULTISPECIES: alpha-galactosidase [unclassified Paenibacillus]